MAKSKSGISPLVRKLKSELTRAESRVNALLQAEAKFRPLVKKLSPHEKIALDPQVKKLKAKYEKIMNLVDF